MLLKLRKIIKFVQKIFLFHEIHIFDTKITSKPIFIIGSPRTGSTMLFQLLIANFKIGYISNIMALLPGLMSSIGFVFKNKIKNYKEVKKSQFGVISGLHSPNEAANINQFWFGEISEKSTKSVKNTFSKLSDSFGGPLIVKAMGNCFNIQNIIKIFPDAQFIYLKRDKLHVAQSILLARVDNTGSMENWWSLKPDGYEEVLNKNKYYQVLWQIDEIEEKIEQDLRKFNAKNIVIDYDILCKETTKVLRLIKKELSLETKGNIKTNSVIESRKILLNDLDWDCLNQELKNYIKS